VNREIQKEKQFNQLNRTYYYGNKWVWKVINKGVIGITMIVTKSNKVVKLTEEV
jgi:hypothetical protein